MSERDVTRVLIAFDCAQPGSEVLRRLPQLLGSEQLALTGLYVEDEDLLRAARLPGLREISPTGQLLELSLERIERELEADHARIRARFEEVARDLRFHHSFEVTRGRLTDAICAAAERSDFVLVSRTLRASGLQPRPAPQFGPLLAQAKSVLFVNEPWSSGHAVVVLGANAAALAAARTIASAESLELVVALPVAAEPPATLPREAVVERLPEWSEDAIARLCSHHDARLLVVAPGEPLDTAALLAGLMDRLPCSLLKLA